VRYTSKKSISGVAKGLEQANTQSLSLTTSDYQSHYNTKLGKCLILVDYIYQTGNPIWTAAFLMDAFERKMYAVYLWKTHETKKYWEVPPVSCELTPSLSAKKFCSSREEFDAFVAGYME
jgi:hypothetical protein